MLILTKERDHVIHDLLLFNQAIALSDYSVATDSVGTDCVVCSGVGSAGGDSGVG